MRIILVGEFSEMIPLAKSCFLKRRWEKRRSRYSGGPVAFNYGREEGWVLKKVA
jgi:hypothetical protein